MSDNRSRLSCSTCRSPQFVVDSSDRRAPEELRTSQLARGELRSGVFCPPTDTPPSCRPTPPPQTTARPTGPPSCSSPAPSSSSSTSSRCLSPASGCSPSTSHPSRITPATKASSKPSRAAWARSPARSSCWSWPSSAAARRPTSSCTPRCACPTQRPFCASPASPDVH